MGRISETIVPKNRAVTLFRAMERIEALESRVAMLEKLVQILQPPAPQ